MNTREFSEALGKIDDRYIEKAISYRGKDTSASIAKRMAPLPLVAAIIAIILIGTAVAAAFKHGDLWIQKPANDPIESVRSALRNQIGKDYTIKIEVKSVEIDKAETERTVERYLLGPIAEWNDWSEEYLSEHFLAVKAVYYAEYDHTQTTRSDGEVTMYFYLTQDVESGEWKIVDNSGNVNLSKKPDIEESANQTAESTEEQIFTYLSTLFNEVYSPYYDGLHYKISYYEETNDGNKLTATFLWTRYFLGKGWDIAADEGVEQEANMNLQVTVDVDEYGTLDFDTVSVLADGSFEGEPDYCIPVEDFFPT